MPVSKSQEAHMSDACLAGLQHPPRMNCHLLWHKFNNLFHRPNIFLLADMPAKRHTLLFSSITRDNKHFGIAMGNQGTDFDIQILF